VATKRSAAPKSAKSAKSASAGSKKAAKSGSATKSAPKKVPAAVKKKAAPAPPAKKAAAPVSAKKSAKPAAPASKGSAKPGGSGRAGRPSEAGPSVAKAIPTGPSGKPLTKAPNASTRPSQKGAPGAAKSSPPAARGGLAPAPRGGLSRPGGRPLPPKPRIDGGLAGGEKIVLVPARASESSRSKAAGPRTSRSAGERAEAARAAAAAVAPPLPLPVRKRDAPMTFEERAASIEKRLAAQSDEFRTRYWDSFYMSWIYHDSALEGVVYTYDELRTALAQSNPAKPPTPTQPPPAPASQPGLPPDELASEPNIQPACEEIRRHREALDHIRDYAKKKGPITIDVIKKIYLILHPEEGDLKTVRYRRDIPQHRLYFHEYAQPDKIAYKVRQVVDWLNDPETKKGRNALRIAARAHYDLLRVFPFQSDSGKVARMFMNLLLLRSGMPPSIIHSAERQRYYDALKGSANQILSMVQESVENAVLSVEKLLDEHDAKARPSSLGS
jgi:hypothetical protein